ncbi:MAG: tRNA (guanosine(46)-N7)-methyltransferase TrmB [Gammaproteobacteria bacterium]|nr:tRNA (guanosine(46)-N7)-methyltransferase TrmB [Gammaproteobacteria bacterium]
MNTRQPHNREIRSFVRREGRITRSQQRALDELWPRYGLEASQHLDLDRLFGRRAARTLEIGFGNGASLAAMAEQEPDTDFIGIEVHRPGVGHLLLELERRGLENVRIICDDAVQVLKHCLPDATLDRVLLFFPDPWPKKRHHKRRIVQPAFIELLARKLKTGGTLHMATDWEDYAEHMLAVMEKAQGFRNCAGQGHFSPRPSYRPVTKFERRGQRLGHGVWDLLFERIPATPPDSD